MGFEFKRKMCGVARTKKNNAFVCDCCTKFLRDLNLFKGLNLPELIIDLIELLLLHKELIVYILFFPHNECYDGIMDYIRHELKLYQVNHWLSKN